MSQGESRATSLQRCPALGLGSKERHQEREQPGAEGSGAVRGVRGSSGGTEQGGSAGGGLGLCRVRIKLSPGIQQGCLSDPCRCSAVAAGGHGRSSPARLEGRWREGREEGGEEPVRSGGQGRAGSGSAGRGESTAPRQSCRQPRAGMTKAARYSPAVCARELSLSFQPSQDSPAEPDPCGASCPPPAAGMPGTLSSKGHSRRSLQ